MKILIADDHAILRKGVIALLRKEFKDAEICETSDGTAAIEKTRESKWDIILLDISMPGLNGIETLKQIRIEGIKTPVLILTMQSEEQYAIRALRAGASGFVNKNCAMDELIAAVHKVLSGRKYITTSISEKMAESLNDNNKIGHELLSDREMQVLVLLASGKTVSDVAVEIFLSANTVSTYRSRILEKLELNNNAELTRYALDNGLV